MATIGIFGQDAEEVARALQKVAGNRHKFVDGAGIPLDQKSFEQVPTEQNKAAGDGWSGKGEDPREERE